MKGPDHNHAPADTSLAAGTGITRETNPSDAAARRGGAPDSGGGIAPRHPGEVSADSPAAASIGNAPVGAGADPRGDGQGGGGRPGDAAASRPGEHSGR